MFQELLAFSLVYWFADAWSELIRSFHSMNSMQWAIMSACSVAFGFLCLRGTKIGG